MHVNQFFVRQNRKRVPRNVECVLNRSVFVFTLVNQRLLEAFTEPQVIFVSCSQPFFTDDCRKRFYRVILCVSRVKLACYVRVVFSCRPLPMPSFIILDRLVVM